MLTGKERSIVRVSANNMYSCLMQKTQRFSSLFRHYSKHHGLPRESLDFFFTVKKYTQKENGSFSIFREKNKRFGSISCIDFVAGVGYVHVEPLGPGGFA